MITSAIVLSTAVVGINVTTARQQLYANGTVEKAVCLSKEQVVSLVKLQRKQFEIKRLIEKTKFIESTLQKRKVISRGESRPQFDASDLRVLSNLDSHGLSKFLRGGLKGHEDAFLRAEQKHGINALFLVALARHESGNGTYKYMDRNNIFSWGANTNSPNDAIAFDSIEDCIDTVAGRLSVRLTKRNDWSMDSVTVLYNASDKQWKKKVLSCIGL